MVRQSLILYSQPFCLLSINQFSSSHALFAVSVTLSEKGVAHWTEVVSELYRYVGMLRHHCKEGLPRWIFDELAAIQKFSHQYEDEQSPEDLVESFAEELAPYYPIPPDRLLDGSSLLFDYDPESIQVSCCVCLDRTRLETNQIDS